MRYEILYIYAICGTSAYQLVATSRCVHRVSAHGSGMGSDKMKHFMVIILQFCGVGYS